MIRKRVFAGVALTAALLATGFAPSALADDAGFKSLMNAGVDALKQSNYDDAIKSFTEAENVAERDRNYLCLALSLSRRADVYQTQKKYSEAEPLFRRALGIANTLKAGRNVSVMCLNGLGTLYLSQNNYSQAETYLKRVLSMLDSEQSFENTNERFLPAVLDNLAVVYRSQKKFAQAEANYKRAIPLWEKVAGPDDADTATSVNNLAALYYYEHKYAEAEPLFQRSLAIREKKLGPDNPEVINTANNLILVYRALKKTSEAEELSSRFAAAKREGSDAPTILTGPGVDASEWSKHVQAGREHLKEQRFPEAQTELETAVKEAEKGGVEDKRLAATLYNLGHVYAKRKEYEKAEATYKRSMAICEKVGGDKDIEVLRTMTSLAKMYTEEKKFDKAEPLFKEVIDIQEKTLGPNHKEVKDAVNNLAAMYLQSGQKSRSASYERRAERIDAKNAKNQL